MKKLTISPDKKTKQIFFASEREDNFFEMLNFIGTLEIADDTTFKYNVGKSAITCIIDCSDSDYLKILRQLQEKDEVKYIV